MSRFILLLAFLVGCSTTKPYERPAIELPAAWKESAPRFAQDGKWWRIYDDPALDDLIDESLGKNTDLLIAAARVDEDGGHDPSYGEPSSFQRSVTP